MSGIDVDLINASKAFAAADTPLYLLKRLRSDPAVDYVSRSHGSDDLLKELTAAVAKRPRTFEQSVFPYVLLLALARQGSTASIRKAAHFAAPDFKWFEYIAAVLIEQFQPTRQQSFRLERSPLVPMSTLVSTSPTTTIGAPLATTMGTASSTSTVGGVSSTSPLVAMTTLVSTSPTMTIGFSSPTTMGTASSTSTVSGVSSTAAGGTFLARASTAPLGTVPSTAVGVSAVTGTALSGAVVGTVSSTMVTGSPSMGTVSSTAATGAPSVETVSSMAATGTTSAASTATASTLTIMETPATRGPPSPAAPLSASGKAILSGRP
jgi:hypothetical protein